MCVGLSLGSGGESVMIDEGNLYLSRGRPHIHASEENSPVYNLFLTFVEFFLNIFIGV